MAKTAAASGFQTIPDRPTKAVFLYCRIPGGIHAIGDTTTLQFPARLKVAIFLTLVNPNLRYNLLKQVTMRFISSLLLASFLATTSVVVSGFTTVSPISSLPNYSRSANQRHRNPDLLRASTAASGDSYSINEKFLRALEKKEALLDKKRAEAMAQLSELEANLDQIQLKKQEYLNGLKLEQKPAGGFFTETTLRSAVKAFMWRVIAGSITFVTSLRFSGSLATAFSIVGSDFFSKSFTMFLGERLMNKSNAGRKSGKDAAGRSLAKALIWRLFAICNTLTVAIFIAKDLSIASKIAGSDAIFKTALMFFYERVWARIEWGKEYEVDFTI